MLKRLVCPLERIEWCDPFTLDANDYNPNVVMNMEMELLKLSIIKIGWIQPALITPQRLIIDGFHRTTIARLNQWEVPCVVLELSEIERMMLTIRINRAKGTHMALRMADIIKRLAECGATDEQICEGIGASRKELDLLRQPDIFKRFNLDKWKYSNAWTFKLNSEKGAKGTNDSRTS